MFLDDDDDDDAYVCDRSLSFVIEKLEQQFQSDFMEINSESAIFLFWVIK